MSTSVFCEACGSPIPVGARACRNCGTVTVVEPSVPVIHTRRTGPASGPSPHRPQAPYPPVAAPATPHGPPMAPTAPIGTHPPGGTGTAAPYLTPGPEPTPDPSRRRGTRIAVAVAALVIVVAGAAGAAIVMTGSGTDSADVTAREATVTTRNPAGEIGRTSSKTKSATVEAPAISPPSTTPAPEPGQVHLGPGVDDPIGAAQTVQDLATALAHGDWTRARAIRPGLTGDDSALEAGYAALDEATVIVSHAAPDGSGVDGAYLAWETTDNGEQTSIYCRHWSLANAGTTVTDEAAGASLQAHWQRWVDPDDVTDEVIGLCA